MMVKEWRIQSNVLVEFVSFEINNVHFLCEHFFGLASSTVAKLACTCWSCDYSSSKLLWHTDRPHDDVNLFEFGIEPVWEGYQR